MWRWTWLLHVLTERWWGRGQGQTRLQNLLGNMAHRKKRILNHLSQALKRWLNKQYQCGEQSKTKSPEGLYCPSYIHRENSWHSRGKALSSSPHCHCFSNHSWSSWNAQQNQTEQTDAERWSQQRAGLEMTPGCLNAKVRIIGSEGLCFQGAGGLALNL